MRGRLLQVAVVAVVLLAVAGALASAAVREGGDDGRQAVDYRGLRVEVDADWFVQDVEGRLDGQLACPDVDGFVFVGRPVAPDAIYTTATCDPPGEETIVSLAPGFDTGGEGTAGETDDLAYRLVAPTQAVFTDPAISLFVSGPDAEAAFADLLASARRSPDGDLATPTTAAARTEVTDRFADDLGCERADAVSTYSRGDDAPFVGRQREAPVDCFVGPHGFRLLVLADDAALSDAVDYYAGVYLVVGPDWLVTATNDTAARFAADRVDGELRPPRTACCGPPTSDFLPGF